VVGSGKYVGLDAHRITRHRDLLRIKHHAVVGADVAGRAPRMGDGGISADIRTHAGNHDGQALGTVRTAGTGQVVRRPAGVGVVDVEGVGVIATEGGAVSNVESLGVR